MQVPADVKVYLAQQTRFTGNAGPWLEHLTEDEGMTFEQAKQMLARWEMIPYWESPHGHMATLLKDQKEVHFAAFRRFRGKGYINAQRLQEFLQPILDKEVFLVTKLDSREDSRFIEHLGFEQLGVTIDGVRTYILNKIKYPEAKPCKN